LDGLQGDSEANGDLQLYYIISHFWHLKDLHTILRLIRLITDLNGLLAAWNSKYDCNKLANGGLRSIFAKGGTGVWFASEHKNAESFSSQT